MSVLVIVDMQRYFIATSKSRTIKNCAQEIRKAIRSKSDIIFVEYKHCGPTIEELSSITKNYKNIFTIVKDRNDGSKGIANVISRNKLKHRAIKVCGVNTGACVQSTVQGLSSIFTKSIITVVRDACNDSWPNGHRSGLRIMSKLPNVLLKKTIKELK